MSAATAPLREKVVRLFMRGLPIGGGQFLGKKERPAAECWADAILALFTPAAESAGLKEAHRRLEDAARAYFNGYMLDEATDHELTGCSDEQHEAALAVGEALADLSLTRAALATTEALPLSAGGPS